MNKLTNRDKEKGFTLIEIVLVLAIAGLILLIVFLAVSGAQKARRDTQRKEDVARVGTLLESYASNNSGSYPDTGNSATGWGTFYTNYVTAGNFKDPATGTTYANGGATATGANPAMTQLGSGATASLDYDISGRTYHLCINLEQGTEQCVNNQ